MKLEAIGENLIVKGKVQKVRETDIFEKIEKPPIYEVIRVIDGIPLFYEEHLERMKKSAEIVGLSLGREEDLIKEDIINIIDKNNIVNENIKLLLAEIKGIGSAFIVYEIASFYPPLEYYTEGIHTILVDYQRENPNAKVFHSSFKQEIKDQLDKNNAFEALLVNKSGSIVEGSRSNMFFAFKDKIYTAKGSDVLLGVTRSQIFKVCKKLNIEIVEENINVEDIKKIDGAFMTGTSVNVLPISTIDNIKLDSIDNRIIVEINNQYMIEMQNYILMNINNWNIK